MAQCRWLLLLLTLATDATPQGTANATCARAACAPADELVIGACEGAEAAAEVLALLARERLRLPANVVKLRPAACANSTFDSPECSAALVSTLMAPVLRSEWAPAAVLGVAVGVDSRLRSGWVLHGAGLDEMGELAPPVSRMCLASPAPSLPATLSSHADLRRVDLVAPYELSASELRIVAEHSQDYCEGPPSFRNSSHNPERCERGPCATLLTSDAAEARLLEADAERWRWRVRVVCVGPTLPALVRTLLPRPLLLCAWAPNHTALAPALAGHFESLAMPPCSVADGCHYESRRLVKFVNVRAVARRPRALRLFTRVSFTLDQYRELAELTFAAGTPSGAAERWLAAHEDVVRAWCAPVERELRVGVIVPASGGSSLGGLGLAAAARLAERDAGSMLRDAGFRLKAETYDGACSERRAVKYVTDALGTGEFGSLAGLVGPGCAGALQAVAAQAHAFRLPVVAYTSTPRLELDEWLLLAGGDARQTKLAMAAAGAALGWRRLAVLADRSLRALADPALLNADVLLHRELPGADNDDTYNIITQWAREVAERDGRVLVVDVQQARWVRAALCAGLRARLEPRGPSAAAWLLPAELDARLLRRMPDDPHNCTTAQLLQMAEGHLSAGADWLRAASAPDERWVRRWRDACTELVAAAVAAGAFDAHHRQQCAVPPLHAPLVYDIVGAYAWALRALLSEQPDAADDLHELDAARSLVRHLADCNRTGLTGEMRLDEAGARRGGVSLYQWRDGARVLVGRWNASALHLDEAALRWATPDGRAPLDGRPRCALQPLADVLHVDCEGAFAVIALLALGALSALLLATFVFCKRRYERRYRDRLRALGLTALAPLKAAGLERWELARERVVINRKLGMGAFGTVYGGHALLAEGRWSAVAVKTLKAGASTEEKLDFLSEAEVMKRFEHKNVVRLLGVVTHTEPVCTVMEFMLYGDLKNYLLARRHLAGGAEAEAGAADEVSSRRLTAMALDVARALSYLADLKYVHRDVAARNCLVSAHRTLKLADFGMTRLVFENDYYRFSRKGLLPVRWMAPESLALGVFSPLSDVWSFGVLLYEIVTFGALPFQGLANGQVLELVKGGGSLTLPTGLKPQLEGLMKSCWQRERRARPAASEIAAFLADSPRLLTPCLDVPFDTLPFDCEPPWRQSERRAQHAAAWPRDTSGSASAARSHDTDTTYLSVDSTLVSPASPAPLDSHDADRDAPSETDRFLS